MRPKHFEHEYRGSSGAGKESEFSFAQKLEMLKFALTKKKDWLKKERRLTEEEENRCR